MINEFFKSRQACEPEAGVSECREMLYQYFVTVFSQTFVIDIQ